MASRDRHRFVVAGLVLAMAFPGCGGPSAEERAREAAEKMRDSLGPDVEGLAVAQSLGPAVAKEVQENLAAIHEYQGEISGKLDSVTVNAIQAFQRSVGLEDHGIVDARTRERLRAAAEAARRDGTRGGDRSS
jgi:murein L,D-transpeptidase YcbB/YkuD